MLESFADAALKILENHSDLAQNGTILGVLAQKPYAFYEPQTHNIWRIVKSSKYLFCYKWSSNFCNCISTSYKFY